MLYKYIFLSEGEQLAKVGLLMWTEIQIVAIILFFGSHVKKKTNKTETFKKNTVKAKFNCKCNNHLGEANTYKRG